ncbi:helix-turn-helix domain-containing protein [Octadecabacter sp. 1_MG-2023]|uniref:TetR/AcrR family transcriptional regulator n=1 Tax=unclassified Octadecabacter TaxID=196158 RepID=UPI001C08FEFD|nr:MULTISPECIES: TetR/AcrR family transcriptional regulator [unclassified Octadecabacter]MBU2993181.1 TetR/AcrR family transcriptional regulator; helix-turn-helix transcriptional regulator [Octadecabacter sp. B2R22]MDO6733367.1 helix-turn-helix domain-containing protein [Octadecabacter sp. 1_MG-2023]
MNAEHTPILDAALEVFLRYGFRRTTMGDIAKAAGLSRQTLYSRFANKDEVYAAGLDLHTQRIVADLKSAFLEAATIEDAMDGFATISIVSTFEMLNQSPDASDLIEAANSPEGQAAMARSSLLKRQILAELFEPYSTALETHGLSPSQLAEFVETNKLAISKTAQTREQLEGQIATLTASVVALTKG